MLFLLMLGIDVEVDVETHGQRRRCRRGMLRGHGGPWWHGMRGGGGCGGQWGMRGGGVRFACHPRGRGFGGPGWCREQPPATTAAAGTQQPAAGAPQPTDNSTTTQADAPHCDPDTNAETGEMASDQYEATAVQTDHDWTLVNDGGTADVEGAATGVEQLHVSGPPPAEMQSTDIYPAIPGRYSHNNNNNKVQPRIRTKFGERAFSHAGPAACNSIPDKLRQAPVTYLNGFKCNLKTHLFTTAFTF